MSFNTPGNMPSFSTDRQGEDNYWNQNYANGNVNSSKASSSYSYPHSRSTANTSTTKSSISADQIKEKLGDFLGSNSAKDLPLYKDKPHFVPKRKNGLARFLPPLRRKRWLVLLVVLLGIWWFASSALSWLGAQEVSWNMRRDMVRHAFLTSWEDYAKFAWGKDLYSPIARKGDFLVHKKYDGESANAGAGWIIVDGLDTAMMMNCTKQVAQARKWIQASLDFGKLDGEISTFETTIRVLGGLLSAHYLSTGFPHLASQLDDDQGQKGEDLYIEKAVDLADRLLAAFDTPTGIPLSSVNLNASQGIESNDIKGASSIAEVATLQLELKYLAKITGEPLYWTMAEKVMQAVDAPRNEGGLMPIFINPQTGKFEGRNIRLGSRGDSYYEYLIKQYLQTGETIYQDMWIEALEGIKRHMITWSPNADLTVLVERPAGLDGEWSGKMDHLTCFLPGTIALGVTGGLSVEHAKKKMGNTWGRKQEEDLILAEELMKTCWGMYVLTPTGLAPEISYLKIDDPPRRWNFDDKDWIQPRSRVAFEDVRSTDYKKKASWRSDYEIQSADVHNLQRPETIESLYYMWRITGKSIYREWGWKIFTSFMEYTKVITPQGGITGYTSLDSVMKIPPTHLDTLVAGSNIAQQMAGHHKLRVGRDNMEGFWLSETLKYLYLLFTDDVQDDWNDLSKIVINTEAHFFPRFDIKGHAAFKTGWTRKPKQATG